MKLILTFGKYSSTVISVLPHHKDWKQKKTVENKSVQFLWTSLINMSRLVTVIHIKTKVVFTIGAEPGQSVPTAFSLCAGQAVITLESIFWSNLQTEN